MIFCQSCAALLLLSISGRHALGIPFTVTPVEYAKLLFFLFLSLFFFPSERRRKEEEQEEKCNGNESMFFGLFILACH